MNSINDISVHKFFICEDFDLYKKNIHIWFFLLVELFFSFLSKWILFKKNYKMRQIVSTWF